MAEIELGATNGEVGRCSVGEFGVDELTRPRWLGQAELAHVDPTVVAIRQLIPIEAFGDCFVADVTDGLITARCCFGVESLRASYVIDVAMRVDRGVYGRI